VKVLIVEDDAEIAAGLRVGLEDAGFVIEVIRDGERAFRRGKSGEYALIVLDVMLPSMDGMTVCRELRSAGVRTPILMLTAKGDVQDRVQGLDAGADDYLPKPFEFVELLARVRALLRRDKVVKSARIEVGDLVVDTAAKTVERGGRAIPLTAREYTLLEALVQRHGQVLTREMIQHAVWVDEFSTSNTVDVHVRNLRKKVDDPFPTKLIHTVFGLGYTLRTEDPS
jgi:DNA-binding response OmpR family regulator